MNISEENIIGELVAEDYRTASVFQAHGIDFCCQGNRTVKDACQSKNLKSENVVNDLQDAICQQTKGTIDYKSWPLDLLADYIEKKHHRYVKEKTPVLKQYLDKISEVHGAHHPELFQIKKEFFTSADELAAHMKKEELVLFPFVRKLVDVKQSKQTLGESPFGTVQNPIQQMMEEHEAEGNRFREIAGLSQEYTPPADGCNTYKVAFALLKEFEQDLHVHIHLENNILFPKAIALEKELLN
ncbi:MAG TPA: iron-sulfur cluster repair di-iron protein [Sphingobacteriaceae bacterium]|nr:iron-sulfur cluster repair di-iron protein [Sphingobacteriaceae bacterium]